VSDIGGTCELVGDGIHSNYPYKTGSSADGQPGLGLFNMKELWYFASFEMHLMFKSADGQGVSIHRTTYSMKCHYK
jgi:hypothetical protein